MSDRKPLTRSLAEALSDQDSYTTTLLAVLMDMYGTEFTQWAPQTLREELQDEFGIQLPPLVMDRIMAGILVLTTDEFYKRLPRFIRICNVLSGSLFRPDIFDPADAYECCWGITEAMLLSPPEEDEPFADEIRRYLGKVLDDEGIRTPPDVLKIAIRDTVSGLPDYSTMAADPSLFAADFQIQNERAAAIEAQVKENLQELLQQLGELRLRHGNTKDLIQNASRHLKA